jgi:hypothetical protein
MADKPQGSAAPDMGGAFRRNAGAPHPEPDLSVNGTARAEIQNREAHENALDAHEQLWRAEVAKLARASDPFPDFDLGSRAHRNLLGEYEERRTNWEYQRDQIDNSFAVQKDRIRQTGQTVANEFSDSQGRGFDPSGNAPRRPAPTRPPAGAQASEFPVSHEHSRQVSPSEDFIVHVQEKDLVKSR